MVRLVLGLIGAIGSGKDTAAEYLRDKHSFFATSFGDTVRAEVAELGLEMTREVQQNLGAQRRKEFGGDYWGNKLIEKIKSSNKDFAVLNGVRTFDDTNLVKKAFGEKYNLVLLEVEQEKRFERMHKRNRPGDPTSLEELRKQEAAEEQKFNFSETVKQANLKINNNSSLEDFHKKIDKLLKQLIK